MAPYATNTDVAPEFKALAANGGFTTETSVSAAQVDEWCTRISNLIDSKLGGKYAVPIDPTNSPNSFSLIKDICVLIVAARVAPIIGLQTGSAKTSTGSAGGRSIGKIDPWATLKEIQSGTMKLNDAVLATSADGAESYTNDNKSTLQPPEFKRKGDQW